MECLALVQQGFGSKQIARELGISPRTVDHHIAAAVERLGVTTRQEAVILLRQQEPDTVEDEGLMFAIPEIVSEEYAIETSRPESIDPVGDAPLPPFGGSINTTTRQRRLKWIGLIAVLCIIATCIAYLSITGLSWMVAAANA